MKWNSGEELRGLIVRAWNQAQACPLKPQDIHIMAISQYVSVYAVRMPWKEYMNDHRKNARCTTARSPQGGNPQTAKCCQYPQWSGLGLDMLGKSHREHDPVSDSTGPKHDASRRD